MVSELPPVPALCDHSDCGGECWKNYPESRFPNWTRSQVKKSKILKAVEEYDQEKPCKLYNVDVDTDGRFSNAEETEVTKDNITESWHAFVANEVCPTCLAVVVVTYCCVMVAPT